jgi:hypothetical protein
VAGARPPTRSGIRETNPAHADNAADIPTFDPADDAPSRPSPPSKENPRVCHAVRCRICQKTTWAGCGHHVEQVMARVPRAQRCLGHSEAQIAECRAAHSPWHRLFRRG